jgi:hypothetical protein
LRGFISRSTLVDDGILRREAMNRILEEHLANRVDHHVRLWMLLNLEVWYRMYQAGWSRSSVASVMDEAVGSARTQ